MKHKKRRPKGMLPKKRRMYQNGSGVGDPPKFGVSKNLLERLGTYGKTRQEAEKDPYYEGRIDISRDDVFDFLIRNLRDSMTDQQKSDMLDQMAKVREVKEGEPVYKSVEGRGHYDRLNKRVYIPEPKKSSTIYRGSLESEEFIHAIQEIMNPRKLSDYGITEENMQDFMPGGKEDLPNRYMPFMVVKTGEQIPLSLEVQQLIDLNPEGISDDVYYGGSTPTETEAMLFSGLIHANKMGVIPEGQTITEKDIPEILNRFKALESRTSAILIPDHARRLRRVLENVQNLNPGSMDLLLKILNQDITIQSQ